MTVTQNIEAKAQELAELIGDRADFAFALRKLARRVQSDVDAGNTLVGYEEIAALHEIATRVQRLHAAEELRLLRESEASGRLAER